ncbi:MAG: hypothetical protein LAT67_11990 [Balneolales bacterium]|nr:hypothetical protein [Balneolales bacterium]
MSYKILSHGVSKFGKLEIALHRKSLEFYELLESKGVISYLKRVDHLGYVSKSYPGNNHKRWDYVMLQLYLLTKLRDKVFKLGLGSNKKIVDTEISGLEYLQIVILFSNMGYVNGTLSSQSGMLHFFEKKPNKKTSFLKNIRKHVNWSEYANKVIKEKDYYSLKYVVALNFLSNHDKNNEFKEIVDACLFKDNKQLNKLNWLHNRIRKICFIYLDSYNSDFPFTIDISKLLLNPANYIKLFNPNSTDFESLFDSIEETLTKKLYIAEKSVIDLYKNSELFNEYLSTYHKKIVFENYLPTLIKLKQNFILEKCEDSNCYQFYLEDNGINYLDKVFSLCKVEDGYKNCKTNKQRHEKDLNSKLSNKCVKVIYVKDYNSKFSFNNIILPKSGLSDSDEKIFILNYLNHHKKFIDSHPYNDHFPDPDKIFKQYFLQDYSRKVMLQLLRILFMQSEAITSTAYIDYQYRDAINKLYERGVLSTGFLSGKRSINNILNKISNKINYADIDNNFGLLSYLINHKNSINRNVHMFYCLFPVQIDKIGLEAKGLYHHENPKVFDKITDLDMIFVLFNKSKYQLFIVEGKDMRIGAESAIKKDFNENFKPLLNNPTNMPKIEYVFKDGIKGGYICYNNL